MSATRPARARLRFAALVAAVAIAGTSLAPGIPATAAPGDPTRFDPELCTDYNPNTLPGEAWQVERLRYPDLRPLATGEGVTVAVIDTGVGTPLMPHLRDASVEIVDEAGATGISKGKFDCKHGSIVTSLLAAAPDLTPNNDYSGIAPGVRVIAYRALATTDPPQNAKQPLGPVIEAIDAAVEREVDIISISQQGDDTSQYEAAIARAVKAGILVVAASGNAGNSGPTYPAAYPGVMAVAMTDQSDQVAEQSQWGDGMPISVAAPGVNVVANLPTCLPGSEGCRAKRNTATYIGNDNTGTSFATPIVAGAAALVMERYPEMTAAEVKARLEETADPPPGGGVDPRMGHGIINPYRALSGPMIAPTGSAEPTAGGNQRVDPPPTDTDTTVRDTGLAIAGIAIGVVLITAVIAAALPAGRRRGWRAAR